MPRLPRPIADGLLYHALNRGNNRAAVFGCADDYATFLQALAKTKKRYPFALYGYCLMTNHFHLLVEPSQVGDLGRFMQSVGRRYVRYINGTYQRSGTLWEGRFKSAAVSRDEYLMVCSRYIELNPVRAGLVNHPREYRWSSYQYRALGIPDCLLGEDPWYTGLGMNAEGRQKAYRDWVESRIKEGEWEQIRQATQRGRLVGREAFQKEIEVMVGRRLIGESRGRPKKVESVTDEKVL